ncbi:hypothetical protein GY45DRAFT_632750 [Cubamyces sp. BRFM 1775]|nr:hypothetical protein GY45DRAFT_632750 [Cubamyces sp. BRFM 1775]
MIRCFSDLRLHNCGMVPSEAVLASSTLLFGRKRWGAHGWRTCSSAHRYAQFQLSRVHQRQPRRAHDGRRAIIHCPNSNALCSPSSEERQSALASRTRLTRPTPEVSHQRRIRTRLVARLLFPPNHHHPSLLCSSFRSSGRALRIVQARQHGSSSLWYVAGLVAGRHTPHVVLSCTRRDTTLAYACNSSKDKAHCLRVSCILAAEPCLVADTVWTDDPFFSNLIAIQYATILSLPFF